MMIQTSLARQVTDSAVEVNASYARLSVMGAIELGCTIRIVRLRGTSYTGKFTGEIEVTRTLPASVVTKMDRTLRLFNVAANSVPAAVLAAWVDLGCPKAIAQDVLTSALAHSRATEVNALVALE